MLVYQGIKSSFIEEVNLGIIADKIREKYIELIHRNHQFKNIIHGKIQCNI